MSVVKKSYLLTNLSNTSTQNHQKTIRLLLVGDRFDKNLLAKINREIEAEICLARDRQEAIEQRDKYNPDIIIIDFRQENHLVFDGLVANKFNVIAIGDFESSWVLTQAIAVGIKGYLKTPSIKDLILAIQAALRGSYYFVPSILERHASFFASFFPTEEKLEKLACYLAVEVIGKWRVQTLTELPPVSEALKNLGLGNRERQETLSYLGKIDSQKSLFDELNLRLEHERTISQISDRQRGVFAIASLQQAASGLESWLFADGDLASYGCRAIVQMNAQNLRVQSSNKLKQYVSEFWSIAGPEPLLSWLVELENHLVAISSYYERQYQEYRDKSGKAWISYQNLLKRLQNNSNTGKSKELLLYAWTALNTVYQFKIQAEISGSASQLVAGLIHQVQSYSNILFQTDDFLLNLQKQIVDKGSLQNASESYLAISLAQNSFPSQLRDELSLAIGSSLNRWGNSLTLTSEHIEHYLLDRLRPLALEIYRESCKEIWRKGTGETTQEF
jgi:hypothetical protein